MELNTDDYIASEWCETVRGYWAACDAYQLARKETIENIGRDILVEYYLKFYINQAETILMMVSNHLSK